MNVHDENVSDGQHIRLLVSDVSPLGCHLLAAGFQPSPRIRIVGSATKSEALVDAARNLAPHVVLVSGTLEDGPLAGYKALHGLAAAAPKSAAVALLDNYDHDLIVDAFRARARGVFFRADPFDNLIKCVEKVHQGQIWASARELRVLLEALAESAPFYAPSSNDFSLTKREQDIVSLVAGGNTNKQISRKLNLSEHTVKNYLFRIFEKVGVGSRVELAIYVMNHMNAGHEHKKAS